MQFIELFHYRLPTTKEDFQLLFHPPGASYTFGTPSPSPSSSPSSRLAKAESKAESKAEGQSKADQT